MSFTLAAIKGNCAFLSFLSKKIIHSCSGKRINNSGRRFCNTTRVLTEPLKNDFASIPILINGYFNYHTSTGPVELMKRLTKEVVPGFFLLQFPVTVSKIFLFHELGSVEIYP